MTDEAGHEGQGARPQVLDDGGHEGSGECLLEGPARRGVLRFVAVRDDHAGDPLLCEAGEDQAIGLPLSTFISSLLVLLNAKELRKYRHNSIRFPPTIKQETAI